MKECSTWKDFDRAIEELPEKDSTVSRIIDICGWLHPQFNRGRLPDGVRTTIRRLDGITREAFSQMSITTINSPKEFDPERENVVYNTIINIATDLGGIGYLDVMAGFPESPYGPPGVLQLDLRLPDGNYHEQTKQLLERMWPEIRGIKLAWPKDMEERERERDT